MKPISRREAIEQGGRLVLGAATSCLLPGFTSGCSNREVDPDTIANLLKNTENARLGDIKLTVIYDNVGFKKGLRTDWGFACLVEGLDKTILFDAGRYDDLFMSNLDILGIDPRAIDKLFISHDHPDHIGGVMNVLGVRDGINVTLVKSFSSGFKKMAAKRSADITEVDRPRLVSNNCLSTGEMKSFVKNEQALVILTDRGSIIITGCAHPGVVDIVARAKKITHQEVLLVAGGFHLLMDDAASIRNKAAQLKKLGVRHVAPTHCSGGEAREIFAEVYGDHFLDSGTGRVIAGGELS
jgi:7,8-dihydropterin-6-yl-methyl-4-(beta-D-ribofuranosyl)aminobenzene 5'-phosphate synthase